MYLISGRGSTLFPQAVCGGKLILASVVLSDSGDHRVHVAPPPVLPSAFDVPAATVEDLHYQFYYYFPYVHISPLQMPICGYRKGLLHLLDPISGPIFSSQTLS